MSDSKTKDITFLAVWIALIVLLGGTLWLFTQNLRYSRLLRSVNNALESVGDTRRLEHIPSLSKHNSLGFWYYEESSEDRAFVFSIMDDGILQPCLAWVSPEGSVIEIFFLQRNTRDATRFSQSIINTYEQRIEQSVLPTLKQMPVTEPLEVENEEEP
ncbi:MAG: hypothetical protein LBJ41_01925 [Treponema sp.]|jgi:hypothetical protein|nr:hypothetical protein [Treponema sp.]